MDKVFTKDELAKYNGKDGAKTYVAVDGVVYDLSNVSAWVDGQHHGNTAGQDLSQAILNAPHKKTVLANLPIVGKYEG